jgi:hypothetical protein
MVTIAHTGAPRVHELSSLARARQIAAVLARHHLWHLIELMALEHMVPIGHARAAGGQTSKLVAPEDLRQALEELGQVLSTRADLLPPEFQTELAQLQDRAPTVPTEAVLAIIEAELSQPVEPSFATFDPAPLATGSIGQAQSATLADGTEVVVKSGDQVQWSKSTRTSSCFIDWPPANTDEMVCSIPQQPRALVRGGGCIVRAPGGPVDLNCYPLRSGPRVD